MKKLISLLLAFLFIFSLTGCSVAEDIAYEILLGDGTSEEADGSGLVLIEDEPSGQDEPEEDPADIDSIPQDGGDDSGKEDEAEDELLDEDGWYTSKDDVALYIHQYGRLPSNFITKKQAQALGWEGGSLEPYAPGKCIGGNTFGNYEGLLPDAEGRVYTECDIDTMYAKSRGAKRIVFSNDGLIYYTDDHYETFSLLYGEE